MHSAFNNVALISLFIFIFVARSYAELITSLPGQPANVSFNQYSGYIVTDAQHGRALFYYFVEADSADPLTRPLTLWLNGGPGCSSLGFGAFMEHGPFQPAENGLLNPTCYISNLLLALASRIPKQTWTTSNGMILKQLGNPLLDLDISRNAGEYLWSHGAISDETFLLERTVCNASTYDRESVHGKLSEGCNDVFQRVAEEMAYIATGDLLLPLCLLSTNAEQLKIKGMPVNLYDKLAGNGKAGDPCLGDRIFTYLNRPDVQKALHANTTSLPYVWDFCHGGPLVYNEVELDKNIIPVVADLIENGVPLTLFSGDQDSKIPLTQTRTIANLLAKDLKLISSRKYAPWFDKKQVGGWAQSFSGVKDGKNVTYLTYATVRGAAHEVPFTNPSQALTLFQAFLTGSPLPIK